MAFPISPLKKCRVLITTRVEEVARGANPLTDLLIVRVLNEEESLELFLKKVFGCSLDKIPEGILTEEMKDVARQMLANCEGLPIAIVLLGGILSAKKKDIFEWIDMLEKVHSDLTESRVLRKEQRSDDNEITMEDVGRECLKGLIQRSMIQVVEYKSNGAPQTCRTHDLVGSLAIQEAKKAKFSTISKKKQLGGSVVEGSRRIALHPPEEEFFHIAEADQLASRLTGEEPLGRLAAISIYEVRDILKIILQQVATLTDAESKLEDEEELQRMLCYHLKEKSYLITIFKCSKDEIPAAGLSKEMMHTASKFLKLCCGLPLVIVLLRKDASVWVNILQSFKKYNDGDSCSRNLISMSYEDLPDYLRSCFLSFRLFREDTEIACDTLVGLWVEEGFLKPSDNKTMANVARDCLEELIQRNLIEVTKRRWSGVAETCRSHGEFRQSLQISKPCLLLDLFWKTPQFRFEQFNLLRALDLESAEEIDQVPNEIKNLTLLRYLSLHGTRVKLIPPWIANLRTLQTLDAPASKIPIDTLKLNRLRHLFADSFSTTVVRDIPTLL
ncbi:probable disease resistance protein At4g27220 [Macadamia integrifolia]|uniref:probable disease resistance protein At4g27220 n=1 Tax=Macadamia integrifolia TaxID=60698 RepID=UPI001C52DBB6|nr:probable disease resistance protein At4g27220 [Macadamia integrifolia]